MFMQPYDYDLSTRDDGEKGKYSACWVIYGIGEWERYHVGNNEQDEQDV
jgi:hypothetical protein